MNPNPCVLSTVLAGALAAAMFHPLPSRGGDALLKLLHVLKERGSISESDYQMLVEAAKAEGGVAASGGTAGGAAASVPSAPAVVPSVGTGGAPSGVVDQAARVVVDPEVEGADRREVMRLKSDQTSSIPAMEAVQRVLKGKWYERVNLRGYAQVRYTQVLGHDGADLHVPNDASASETSSFLLRRGRVIFSEDATDRLFVYVQADFNASLSSGDFAMGMRDYYGDVALDADKEFRVRVGQSKVPFGWSNLQSSQNRAPMERADGINSAVEGERDIGAFAYWAPDAIRQRYRDLVRQGLKGSGDYGVAGIGLYSGQGLNRLDVNGEPHGVARLNHPWKLADGQYVEVGLQAYHGRFVSGVGAVNLGSGSFTPSRPADGVVDERVAASFVWYPQPFGIEAEWMAGRGPELDPVRRVIDSRFLHGGYVQASYRVHDWHGDWYPFARWQLFDGGRKFASNAPHSDVHEVDFGIEWQPYPEVELTVSYTHTVERTNTRLAPYVDTTGADRIAFQVQVNY